MSRSRKRHPVVPMTSAESDKDFKKREHRRERADVRAALATARDPKEQKEFGNPALADKDRKQFVPDREEATRK